jgi:hypothetical protein
MFNEPGERVVCTLGPGPTGGMLNVFVLPYGSAVFLGCLYCSVSVGFQK